MSERTPGVGVDVGTAFLVRATDTQGEIKFRKERDAFFSMEASDATRNVLELTGAAFIEDESEDQLYVIGEQALQMATMIQGELRRPLSGGVISNKEREAIKILDTLISTLVGPASVEGETLHYTVPANPANADFDIVYHENILNSIFNKLGYDPKPINEALCIAYSQLIKDKLTGITISMGSGMTNFCLTFLGMPAVQFSIVGGGDSIDRGATKAVVGRRQSQVTARKEKGINILTPDPSDDIEVALSIYYKNLIEQVVKGFAHAVKTAEKVPNFPEAVPVVIAGGTSLAGGCIEYFENQLRAQKLPFEIGEVRHAPDALYTVADGALKASLIEERKKNKE
jgi:actin-like ATPase involved in cell morphogenesis